MTAQIRAFIPLVLAPVADVADAFGGAFGERAPTPRPQLAAETINGGETFVTDGERTGVRLSAAYRAAVPGAPEVVWLDAPPASIVGEWHPTAAEEPVPAASLQVRYAAQAEIADGMLAEHMAAEPTSPSALTPVSAQRTADLNAARAWATRRDLLRDIRSVLGHFAGRDGAWKGATAPGKAAEIVDRMAARGELPAEAVAHLRAVIRKVEG